MQPNSKINYRSLFNNTLDGLAYCQMIFNEDNHPVDFIYLDVSKNFEQLTGLKNVVGKKVTEVIPGIQESNDKLFEIYGRVALTGKAEKFEIFIRPLNKWFLVSVYCPKKRYFIAVFQNTTEQKRIEKKLEDAKIAARNVFLDLNLEKNKLIEAKAKDEAILRSVADGLMVWDKEGRIVLVNESFEQILGWQAKDVYGKFVYEVIPMTDEKGIVVPEQERLAGKTLLGKVNINASATIYYKRKDETLFPVSLSVSPIMIGNELIGAVEVFRDITKEKEIDRAKTEFVSLASHQLKTPPTAIKLLTERMLSGRIGKLNLKQQEYINDIALTNQRMIDLVNTLLNVSRIELGEFSIHSSQKNICEIIKSLNKESSHALAKKNLHLKQLYTPKSLMVMLDEPLFRIAIGNLITNAINYTAEGGTIKVKIRKVNKGQVIGGKSILENCLAIIISDTGCGIPKKQQSKLFTKFFRADNAKKENPNGTGLGLYIVKSIIENSGGLIWFISTENKGSVFYVTIPMVGMINRMGEKRLISS